MTDDLDETNLDRIRLAIEREKLDFEKNKIQQDNSLFRRNFGAIIAALVSLAAVTVTSGQVYIAHINNMNELRLQSIESERAWKLEAAKFVALHRDTIFSSNALERSAMRNVIKIASDISNVLTEEIVEAQRRVDVTNYLREWLCADKDCEKVVVEGVSTLRQWMMDNIEPDMLLFDFLFQPEYEQARTQAVRDLEIVGDLVPAALAPIKHR